MRWLQSLVVLFLGTVTASAADWPQWLGPTRDSVTPEKIAPWKEAPASVWRQPVGEGHSSPVIAGGKVYLHTKVKDRDEEELTAFDAQTGKVLWSTKYPKAAFTTPFGNGPRATPTVANGRVYTNGIIGVLSCFDAGTGKPLWQVDTLKQFDVKNLVFGVSCSPLVVDGKVLVNVGGKGAGVVAFDAAKGEVAWKSLDDGASYSSPILLGEGGQRQVVFLTQQGLVGLNPADGGVYWKFPLVDRLSESSTTPVLAGDLLLGSSVTYGSAMLKLGSENGKPTAAEAWKSGTYTCYFSTPVPLGGQLYMVNGSIIPPPQAMLRCVDLKTGKELWRKTKIAKYHAAFLRTGDDKLLMLDDAGNLMLLDPDPKEYRELARAKVCGDTWAHPALADGKLYIRDKGELVCVQFKP